MIVVAITLSLIVGLFAAMARLIELSNEGPVSFGAVAYWVSLGFLWPVALVCVLLLVLIDLCLPGVE